MTEQEIAERASELLEQIEDDDAGLPLIENYLRDAIAAELERAEKAEAALARVARKLARVTREMDLAIAAMAGIGEGAGGD
jgi:hypothetical protein